MRLATARRKAYAGEGSKESHGGLCAPKPCAARRGRRSGGTRRHLANAENPHNPKFKEITAEPLVLMCPAARGSSPALPARQRLDCIACRPPGPRGIGAAVFGRPSSRSQHPVPNENTDPSLHPPVRAFSRLPCRGEHADLCQNTYWQDHHPRCGVQRHHRCRQGEDPGQGGHSPGSAASHLCWQTTGRRSHAGGLQHSEGKHLALSAPDAPWLAAARARYPKDGDEAGIRSEGHRLRLPLWPASVAGLDAGAFIGLAHGAQRCERTSI